MHNKKNTYQRKLSAIERYNVVINEVVRYNVDAVVEGRGELDADQWRKAVAVAADANPGTRVRLKSFLGFSKWVDSGIAPNVKVISAPEWDGNSEVGTEFLQQKFNVLEDGPVCEINLLPGDPARVIFRGAHAALDARGLSHFLHDTFRVLRGEQPIGSINTITDLDIRLKFQDKVTTEEQSPQVAIPVMPTDVPDDHNIRYIWRRVTINKDLKNPLPKMALFLAEQARSHNQGDVVFTIPVDFRTLRHEVNSTANLTGYLRINVEPDDSPKTIMRKLNQQIRDHADCRIPGYTKILPWIPIGILTKQLAAKANTLLHTPNNELPSGGIVSLGYFNAEAVSYPGFLATGGFGIPGSVGKLNVLTHNFSDSTEIIFSTPAAYNSEGQLDNLIEEFKAGFDTHAERNRVDSRRHTVSLYPPE